MCEKQDKRNKNNNSILSCMCRKVLKYGQKGDKQFKQKLPVGFFYCLLGLVADRYQPDLLNESIQQRIYSAIQPTQKR